MELIPGRRGCLHYGALVLCLLMALGGVFEAVWVGYETRGVWHLQFGKVPHPSTREVRAAPAAFVKRLQAAREPRDNALEAIADFCTGFVRVLGVAAAFALVAALTTPGRPRFLRFADWRGIPDLRRAVWLDFALAAGSCLLFGAGNLAALALRPDLSRLPLPPASGEELSRRLATDYLHVVQAARCIWLVGGVGLLLSGTLAYRFARHLSEGFRAERRRRRAESNARTVGQF
jgi:hypothetical protein